jgi:cardiolipin synthase A/B
MQVIKRVLVVLGGLLVTLLALIGMLTLVRGTPLRSIEASGADALPAVGDSQFIRTMELVTGTKMLAGNRVEVLSNGNGTYPRLWSDLRSAQRSITVQMYFSKSGAVADTLASILAARARAGVRILVLLDAFGSQELLDDGSWMDTLESAGVRVAELRPLKWLKLQKASQRSHARVVVIDGVIGYTGGFGLADYWLGDGRTSGQWREANIRFEGPAATQLQAAFVNGWAEATGELPVGDLFFPSAAFEPRDGVQAALLHTVPTLGSTPAERFLAMTISGARRTLYVTNSYFVPDDDLRRMLVLAARRGVDVRVMTVGPETDVKTTLWAGRRHYARLLEGGVRVYEYQPTMMHAKTIVADGIWSTVGSMNFDNRSIAFNNETNLIVMDAGVGATMDSLFREDLRYSKEIRLEEWRHRPWWYRPLERGAGVLSKIL